jgi:hypothetical protein
MKAFALWGTMVVFFLLGMGSHGLAQAVGGDIYVLQNIDFGEIYKGQIINVDINIENKKVNNYTKDGNLNVTIRDDRGEIVSGFDEASFIVTFVDSGDGTRSLIKTILLDNGAGFAVVGETYTLFARIKPYFDEDVNGNNYGIKTFTVVSPPNPISVPDAPVWMPVLLASIILGWLFAGNKEGEK